MQRLWEILLGLEKGFLGREGEFSVQFNPRWPFSETITPAAWNIVLGLGLLALVWNIYKREARTRGVKILLGVLRGVLMAVTLVLLNRPTLTLTQTRTEPSNLAIAIDKSLSMQVRDAGVDAKQGVSRLGALQQLFADDRGLAAKLAEKHMLKFYTFSRDAQGIMALTAEDFKIKTDGATTRPSVGQKIGEIVADGQSTQILASVQSILQDLQGRQLAGVIVFTDGRSTPAENVGEGVKSARQFSVPIFPVAVGSEKPAKNLAVDSIDVQDAAFAGDVVSARVKIRTSGFPKGQEVRLTLKDATMNLPLIKSDGKPAQITVIVDGTGSQEVEVTFKPKDQGTLRILAELLQEPGEIDIEDNTFPAQMSVLEAKIRVLYVDGYPRWEYRYLKNEMIRDKTVDISCLLLSADPDFAQEGDSPIKRFPEIMSELMAYDAVIFGDVDPRNFTEAQLMMVSEFVTEKNGGFGMVAGPKWSPYLYRNTPIEPILPVTISRSAPPDPGPMTVGWRPVLTRDGERSTIFRFFEEKDKNSLFMKDDIQPLFWYCRGLTAKPGIGEVYAEHPSDTGPDGRKAPLLVFGRFGGGRTLFSAIDDSWRWRYYTNEAVFDNYWVQQLRYLSRAKKLGQRLFTLNMMSPSYELGDQARVNLSILDPELQHQLPDQLTMTLIRKEMDGTETAIRQERLQKQEGQQEKYSAGWTVDQAGQFYVKVDALAGTYGEAAETPVVFKTPKLELIQPDVDKTTILSRLMETIGTESGVETGKLHLADETEIPEVMSQLLKIPSVAREENIYTSQLLWNAPIAMAIFVLVLTIEWVVRKLQGML